MPNHTLQARRPAHSHSAPATRVFPLLATAIGVFVSLCCGTPALHAQTTGSTGDSTAFDNTQPTTALRWVIAANGIYPSRNGSGTEDVMIAEVRAIAWNASLPTGFFECDGQLYSINSYPALYSLVGTIYGGNGITTFGVPDLRGRVIIHEGQGSGLNNRTLGSSFGSETTALSISNLPGHQHTITGGSTNSTGSGTAVDNTQPSQTINALVQITGSSDSLGMIRFFAGNFAPADTAFADGATLSTGSYPGLFAKLGTTFGGNGSTTFGLPDLRGRTIVGVGTGTGLSAVTLGQSGGAETFVMAENQMPAHTHSYTGGTTGSTGGSTAIDSRQPYLGLTGAIATAGTLQAIGSLSSPGLGEVRFFPYAAGSLPTGWTETDGQLLPIASNTDLFSLLGTGFGGDGTTTMGVPDLRGRTNTSSGQGAGLTNRALGSTWGNENVPLAVTNLPAHTHTYAPPNSVPTDIGLSPTSINQSATSTNATVGTLSTTDSDSGDSHTYTLVSGTGDTNNGSFNISGSTLRTNSALSPGSYNIRVNTNDGTDDFAKQLSVTVVDDVAPNAPSTPDLTTATDSGSSNSDNITNNLRPAFSGTAEAGSTVTLFVDTIANGSFDFPGDTIVAAGVATGGNYSLTAITDQSPGTLTVRAVATDAASNRSAASAALSITIDTTAPVITSAGTTSGTYGGSPSYTVSASGAATSFGATGLPAGLSVNSASGIMSGSATAIGLANATVTATDAAGNTGNAALAVTINPKPLTITGLTGDNKTYNDTTAATATGTASLSGVETGDNVSLGGSPTFTFASANVGTGITITTTGYTISGTDSGNYTLTQPTLSADITAATLTITGLTGDNKTYDDTTAATATGTASLSGVIGSNDVSLGGSPTFTFASANVGTGITINTTGYSISGTDSGNYTLTQPTLSADITAKALTITGVTGDNKTYDGTTAGTASGTASLSGLETGDDVTLGGSPTFTFASANVGTGITVTTTGYSLSGTDSGNYTLTQPTLSANITAATLTVTGLTGDNKVYDDTAVATASGAATLSGVAGADDVTLTGTPTFAFADALIGDGKTIIVTGYSLSGTDVANYTLTQPALFADITAREITVSGLVALDKVYDGTDAATIDDSGLVLNGVQGDDSLAIDDSGVSATFGDKTIGTGKAVTITGAVLTGAQAGNYTLTLPTNLTADITAAGLTVSGATVTTRAYDTTTTATLDFSGASLVGVQGADDVTLDASGATGTYASAGAGTGIAVTVSGVALSGADAGNYTLTQPGLTGDITQAIATIALADLSQTYTGSALVPTVTTTPAGLNVTLTYDGAGTTPTEAGTYTLVATIVEANYQGSANDTFEITKADQTVTLTNPGTLVAGMTTTLAATATSGLDVTFSLDTGVATLVGNALTPQATNAITLRATQAGDNNYNPAEATLAITDIVKQDQTIDFAALEDKRANDGDFDLSATATSGLDVTFTIVSGPAMLTGNTVSMTGATGTVTVRADQAGNAIYNAAPAVTRTFEVVQAGPLVYFGTDSAGEPFAINIPEGQDTGLTIGTLPDGRVYFLQFRVEADRSITALALQLVPETVSAADLARAPLRARVGKGTVPPSPAANFEFTFTGTLIGGQAVLQIEELGLSLNAQIEPADGPTADIAGLYEASSLNSANGTTTSIVGTTGKVLVVAVTPDIITSATGTLADDGSFSLQADDQVIIQGEVDAPTTTVSGTLILPSGEEDDFEGLSTGTLRTDRLINLSTRAFVDVAEGADLVTGFVIGGPEPKRVLLRAVGPTLAAFGITQALPDPQVTIYDGSGNVVAEVDDWGGQAETAAAMTLTGAFTLAEDSLDAAHVTELDPGVYTMRVVNNSEAGITLAEIYDASENPNSQYQRLVNISSRGRVVGGQGVLVGGFIVTGNSPKRVLVRGVGPGLADYGVSGALADPLLKVYNAQEEVIASNDDWQTPLATFEGQRTASGPEIETTNNTVGAFALQDGSADAGLVITLSPGLYTVELSSADQSDGTALIEVYEIPDSVE